MNDQDVLTVADAAEWLRASPNYVYELVRKGELPAFRLGRAIRILKDELVAFAKRMQEANSDE